jgi:hypothetical protein
MADTLLTQIAHNFSKHSSMITMLVIILLLSIVTLAIMNINLNPDLSHNIGKVVTVAATT